MTVLNPTDVSDDDYPYKSNLVFSELSVGDVGYYYCILKDVHDRVTTDHKEHYDEEIELKQASGIYVFVNGRI